MIKRRVVYIVKYLFLGIAALLSLFPLLWMMISSTNKSVDVITGQLLPGAYLVENLKTLLNNTNLTRAIF